MLVSIIYASNFSDGKFSILSSLLSNCRTLKGDMTKFSTDISYILIQIYKRLIIYNL